MSILLNSCINLSRFLTRVHNLKVKIIEGAILDATLIEAAVNPQAKPKLIVEDRNEDDIDNSGSGGEPFELSANQQSNIEIDPDAKWLKKGKHNIFGFLLHDRN